MPGFKRSVSIQKPVEQVFDFATDLANARRVMPNVTKTEMLTDSGLQTGARFRETRLIKGKERSSVIEIVTHERPRLHVARSAMMGMQATYTFRFAAEDSGTRVDMEADVKGQPALETVSGHDRQGHGERGRRVSGSVERCYRTSPRASDSVATCVSRTPGSP